MRRRRLIRAATRESIEAYNESIEESASLHCFRFVQGVSAKLAVQAKMTEIGENKKNGLILHKRVWHMPVPSLPRLDVPKNQVTDTEVWYFSRRKTLEKAFSGVPVKDFTMVVAFVAHASASAYSGHLNGLATIRQGVELDGFANAACFLSGV